MCSCIERQLKCGHVRYIVHSWCANYRETEVKCRLLSVVYCEHWSERVCDCQPRENLAPAWEAMIKRPDFRSDSSGTAPAEKASTSASTNFAPQHHDIVKMPEFTDIIPRDEAFEGQQFADAALKALGKYEDGNKDSTEEQKQGLDEEIKAQVCPMLPEQQIEEMQRTDLPIGSQKEAPKLWEVIGVAPYTASP